ncbi:MAG: DNA-formamidopyrimidine glycosylase [Oscillatoriales cyanobacterium SM2_2_1]|nr:DNA-formamidopyrimidine glycosylase [Oscillatoriales cyanobacterium SM2_2_1]
MPELPEVETVCRGLNRTTCGGQIIGGEVRRSPTLAHPTESELWLWLVGQSFVRWGRRGKYLIGQLTGDRQLVVHLRMTGALRWCAPDEPLHRHTRLRLYVTWQGQERELRFEDQRTFGQVWGVPPGSQPEAIVSGLARLGREPFDPLVNGYYLWQRWQRSRRAIKSTLLDQAVVAGLGNIYADEALFLAGIYPEVAATDLDQATCDRLHGAILRVLGDGITQGGTTFSNFQDVAGDRGNYLSQSWVFRRTGLPCRVCSTPVQRLRVGGRSTHFCPQCQPRP